jgi:hypothetical protein
VLGSGGVNKFAMRSREERFRNSRRKSGATIPSRILTQKAPAARDSDDFG